MKKNIIPKRSRYYPDKEAWGQVLFYLFLILYLGAIYQWGWMGFWVGTGLAIAFTIIRVAINWKQYVMSVKYIEMLFFGKPLDKEYWKKEKPQIPKIKWKSKK